MCWVAVNVDSMLICGFILEFYSILLVPVKRCLQIGKLWTSVGIVFVVLAVTNVGSAVMCFHVRDSIYGDGLVKVVYKSTIWDQY